MPTGYISEIKQGSFLGLDDFVEVAVEEGTDVSGWTLEYHSGAGALDSTWSFPEPTSTEYGYDVYLFDSGTLGAVTGVVGGSFALVDDTGQVVQLITLDENATAPIDGAAAGMEPTYIGTPASDESMETTDGGQTYQAQSEENPGTIPCFAPGMMVDCPEGPRPVEDLAPGDEVLTLDNGPQPIIWASVRRQLYDGADRAKGPILIRAGALGGLPTEDLIVSPQHRLLIGGVQGAGLSEQEVLAPAKAFLDLPKTRCMRGKRRATWHHFALERHEIVRVNGVWTETLLLGEMVLNGLTRRTRVGLAAKFPDPGPGGLNGPPARPLLRCREAQRLLDGARMPAGTA